MLGRAKSPSKYVAEHLVFVVLLEVKQKLSIDLQWNPT